MYFMAPDFGSILRTRAGMDKIIKNPQNTNKYENLITKPLRD